MVSIRWNRLRPLVFTFLLASLMLLSIFAVLPLSGAQSGTSQLTVSSQNTNGQVITGYYTILYGSSNNVLETGFTPAAFALNNGVSYYVRVDNYGSCSFDHWMDTGSSSALRQVSISSNTQITAIYNCGGGSPSSLTVNSVDQSGKAISGYYVILSNSAGGAAATGFTPTTFSTASGNTYSIQADGYQSCVFSQWSDGVTSNPRTFTSSAGMTLTAVYACGTSGGGPSSVGVKSISQNGTAISGYYTVLYDSSGSVLATGFTPATFTTTAGQVYSVRVENYGSCVFANWTNGATSDPMTFTATSAAQTFTAVYNCGGTIGSSNGITVTANRIPASYWAPCFATTCSLGTGPGASMYFTLYDSSGKVVATGFADEHGHTFTGLNASATYYVYPADCDSCHGSTHDVLFQYWGNSTGYEINSTRPLAVKVGETVNAWYSCTNGCGGA